jgi:hypothetical protein
MAKVGRAAYAHSKERITILEAASTLTANDTGETLVLNHATGFTTTLPAAKKGQHFRVVIAVSSIDGNLKIAAASGEYFYGNIKVVSTTADNTAVQAITKATASGTPADHDHLKLDGNLAAGGGLAGDCLELYCVEDGGWLVVASICSSAADPGSVAVIAAS